MKIKNLTRAIIFETMMLIAIVVLIIVAVFVFI